MKTANSPVVNILIGDPNLRDIEEISNDIWQTQINSKERRTYENIIYRAFSKRDNVYFRIVVGRWSDNADWDVRLRIPSCDVIAIDKDNSLIAWRGRIGTSVSNGFQEIRCIEHKIPKSSPRKLREFAQKLLDNK